MATADERPIPHRLWVNGRAAEPTPLATGPHFPAKARAVISLFMHGGPSQVDTFDPKPMLAKYSGQTQPDSFRNLNLEFTQTRTAKVLPSRHRFQKCRQSGVEMSDIVEHLPLVADELAVIRSCHHSEFNHAPALDIAHSGLCLMGRPSLGSWALDGLGSPSRDLPGYVVMRGRPLKGGPMTYGNGFPPAEHSATELSLSGTPILYLDRPEAVSASDQCRILGFSQRLNRRHLAEQNGDDPLSARIAAYELAYRMQSAAPEAIDLSRESPSTRALYGLDNDITRPFGTQCLNARRLVKRGVRFVQLYQGGGGDGWDSHGAMDDFGFRATENPVQVRDLHATILHLPGLRHDRLTDYFQGPQQRLTQVDGDSRVLHGILA